MLSCKKLLHGRINIYIICISPLSLEPLVDWSDQKKVSFYFFFHWAILFLHLLGALFSGGVAPPSLHKLHYLDGDDTMLDVLLILDVLIKSSHKY